MSVTTDNSAAPGEMACPDPSVHEHHDRLSEAASTAALLATKPKGKPKSTSTGTDSPLGSDGKLSSRSAAQSLKYANPTDLPSFPSRGGNSSAAGAAAVLAKDYKGREMHRPEASLAGSKAAALAHKDGGKLDLWQPSPSSAGNSAASLAMRDKGLSPQLDRGYTDAGRTNSLLAATMSYREGRQRAGSTPVRPTAQYPDSQNSGKNALNAATVSHRASTRSPPEGWNDPANQAARVKNMHMDRDMFTEHPPVQPEVDEKRHQAALRASAVSMAKQMYEYEDRKSKIDSETSSSPNVGTAGAETAHRRNQSSMSQTDIKSEAIKYIHLQDAAHKLAQERLAQVEKGHEQERYREYYGYPNQSPRKSRLSVRNGRGRKRASSEGQNVDDSSDDEQQARRIRSQMTTLSTGINKVDNKQRSEDRQRLMAAAEKRVHARMHDIDEKVFQETGKVSQAMMDEWEVKAREKAEKDRQERERTGTTGKTHIGGGKFMDQSEIEAIAAARLKPTFDELNDTAQKKRERDEELRVERDKLETSRMEEKMKDHQVKAEFKRIKEQDKAAAKREREERKARERAEKEEARARKSEDKRKSREQKKDEVAAVAGGAALAEVAENVKDDGDRDREVERGAIGLLPFEEPTAVVKDESKDEPKDEPTEVLREEAKDEPEDEPKVVVPVEEPSEESKPETKEVPKPEPKEEPKERASGRVGMFSSIRNKLKRRGDEDKPAEEPKRSVEDPKPAIAEVEKADEADDESEELSDDDAAAVAVATIGTGIPVAGDIQEEHALEGERSIKVEVEDRAVDAEEHGEREKTAAIAGAAALGAVVAAGAMEMDRPKDHEDTSPEVSSLSTHEDEPDSNQESLKGVTTAAEHTGDYNFASPSPALERKPDLMRHISTIQDSSGSEPEDLTESDYDENTGRLEPHPTMIEPAEANEVEERGGTLPHDAPLLCSEVHTDPVPQEEERAPSPVSPLSPPPQAEEEDNIGIISKEAPPDAPPLATVDYRPSTAESGAPAPVVKTGPEEKETKLSTQPEKKEEDKGLRGFFRKLKNRSKADNKLQKARASSGNDSEKSFQGGAKYTGTTSEKDETTATSKDDTITPVTTTSAGNAAEGEHIGIDGPIGDPKHVSGLGGDPGPASPSSFERHGDPLRDIDDVSSSGAEEEDVTRGRTGRLVKNRPGNKDNTGAATNTNGDEDPSEEARDTFDESLAPPPAFGGQPKSESPVRETRFQEQL